MRTTGYQRTCRRLESRACTIQLKLKELEDEMRSHLGSRHPAMGLVEQSMGATARLRSYLAALGA